MEKQTFTREEITAALVPVYQTGFAEYVTLDQLADELNRNGEKNASEVVRRYVYNRSSYMDGVKKAAEALGIGDREFRAAVTSGEDKA